ncbi:signal peptidase II [Candidatus Woesearchaeota archaeon]|jgi:signal peptidase II|nr:signal peptidase II [Candidatus Woesearchaeota archaeon]MBT4150842.1 signal peptidase II [Candidatus Woesearchaeota archaeon]MBT4246947.1 signal peptidase II [Candidatus Woesearchaeota archaeon]MBT4433632.1 signal peptidase II [Candidatus Woesearchaeota archaeon]MBT7332594.1 signal peptidase II [Candidatus Woesearchaeota archaeon]
MVNYKKFFWSIVTLVVVLDQLTKYLISTFKPNLDLVLLKIHYLTNTGAGFSILTGKTWILAIISLIVIIGLIYYYKDIPKQKTPQLLFALFLGGAIGNFIDRALRNYVIDFIDFGWWPAFNIADMALTISVVGLILYYIIEEKSNKK